MANLDHNIPIDTEIGDNVDDYIRQLKTEIENSFNDDSHKFEVEGGTDFPIIKNILKSGTLGARPAAVNENEIYINTDNNYIQKANSLLNWEDICGVCFPAGTKVLFCNSQVPSGFTLDNTINDRLLRIVNTAGGGTGGDWVGAGWNVSVDSPVYSAHDDHGSVNGNTEYRNFVARFTHYSLKREGGGANKWTFIKDADNFISHRHSIPWSIGSDIVNATHGAHNTTMSIAWRPLYRNIIAGVKV